MQKYLFTSLLVMISVFLVFNTAVAGNEYEKDAKYWNEAAWLAQEKAENMNNISNSRNIEKHPGDNDYDMFWDNATAGYTISDDVEGLSVTDPSNDLDQDGFAEMIVSDDDGNFYIFENTGDNSFALIWSDATNINYNTYGSTTFGDFDQNGRVEALFSIYENDSAQVRFYEWDGVVGSNNFVQVKRINIYDYETSMSYGVRNIYNFGDMDGDALNELVVCSDDSVHVFEIDNAFNVTYEAGFQGIGGYSVACADFGDMDNDGTPELIFGHYNYQSIYFYHVTGADTYVNALPDTFEYQSNPADDGFQYHLDLVDVDGDGWLDLYSVDNDGRIIVTYLTAGNISDSTLQSAILREPATTGQDVNSITHGDVDEDGLLDFYFTSDDNFVYNWEYTGGDITNPANYVEYNIGELNVGSNPEECVYGPDLDGDGERDFVVGYEGSSGNSMLFFLEHHVIPQVPALSFLRNDFFFDHLWNVADVDTEMVPIENIGTVDLVIDSIVSPDPVFSAFVANATVPALGTGMIEVYFTALDQAIHDGYMVVHSNSTTAPDTLWVYGDSRAKPMLYINEFQPKSTEWIEIYNGDTNPIDLTDIGITTGRNTFTPANLFGTPEMDDTEYFAEDAGWGPTTSLAGGALLTNLATSLSPNNSQDWLYIVFKDSAIIDGLGYGAVGACPLLYNTDGTDPATWGSAARVAYTGDVGTDWTGDLTATPDLPNDCPAPDLGGSIIINEVDYDENVDGQWEYVEFYNPTGSDITMNNWWFTDGDDIFVINGITVPSMGVAVWHDSTNLSMAAGDVAYLYDDTGVRKDQIGFADFNPVEKALIGTLQRIPDGAGPHDGYDYWSSGGGVTWFDKTHTMGSLNSLTYVIFTAQVGGDSQYRSFWMNGSWDDNGNYDPNWTGPMVELKNDGIWPDTSALDSTFTGLAQLLVGTTYQWWVGSENDINSWMENGTDVTPDSIGFINSQTCIVDPSDTGFNQWTIGAAGDAINSWNNADDNLTRNGWEWSGVFNLPAGQMAYKFVVMHSWEAAYGDGGIGGAGNNFQYNVPISGDYLITFNDSTNKHSIARVINEDIVTITTPELTTAVTNEGTIGMLNTNGGSPGFTWGASGQLLYEAGLMVGTTPDHVVDAARAVIGGTSSGGLDADFQFLNNVNVVVDDADSTILVTAFDDSRANLAPLADDGPNLPIGVEVNQTTYSYKDAVNSGYVIYKLEVTNTTGATVDDIVVGAYFDWDIGTWDANTGLVEFNSVQIPGVNSGNAFDAEFAYIYDPAAPNIYMGAVPLSQNYFLASRVLHQPDEVYSSNFSEANKYTYMSERRASDPYGPGGANQDKGLIFGIGGGTGGAGTVPGSGFSIPSGGTVTVGFAIVGGNDVADFVANGTAAMEKWVALGNDMTVFEFVTGIDDLLNAIPKEFALHQNFPNPFNPSTTIKYDLPKNSEVLITIYDMLGREVKTLLNDKQDAGYKQIVWNGTNNYGAQVSTGIYFYKLRAGDFVQSRKMILMK